MAYNLEIKKISKQEHAYNAIKDMIILNDLKTGTMLVEESLSDMLSISRTPIRGALNSLVKDRLVTFHPGKGMFVSEVRIEDVLDIYMIRELLDPLAIKLYMHKFGESSQIVLRDHVDKMKQSLLNNDYINFSVHDFAFHIHYLTNTGNALLGQISNMFLDHTRRFFNLKFMDLDNHERSYNDHLNICVEVEAQNIPKAQEAVHDHIIKTKEYHIKNLSSG